MKKIICVLIAAVMLLAAGCSPLENLSSGSLGSGSSALSQNEKKDIMQEALNLLEIESLENVDIEQYGQGAFDDYSILCSDPLSIADYSLKFSDDVKNITGIGSTGDFALEFFSENSFGFEKDFCNPNYKIHENIDDSLTQLFNTVGNQEGLSEAKESFKLVETRVKESLAKWISGITAAYSIFREQNQNITPQEFRVCQNLVLSPENYEEQLYEVKKIAQKVDLSKIISASIIVMKATGDLKQELKLVNNLTKNGEYLEVETPIGTIYLGSNGDDVYRSPSELLILDLYGNDKYYGRVGANSSLSKPIAVAIDFGGDDIYDYNSYNATQGAGIFGVGIAINDFGNDEYIAKSMSQGAGVCGVGVLIDSSGRDKYESLTFSQAAAFFGVGSLSDFDGNDTYHSYIYSQAFASNNAVAFLMDKFGSDNYYVELSEKASLPNSRTDGFVNNFSQGCAVGVGNLSDANSLAGGIAGLVDINGDDRYLGSACVQGYSSLGGVAMLSDLDGNDEYISNCTSQAVSQDFSVSSLVDVDGNDLYFLSSSNENVGQSAVLGGGASLLLNDGGNDVYLSTAVSCAVNSMGSDSSYALFIETEGDDIYSGVPSGFANSKNCVFLDGDGNDMYSVSGLNNKIALGKLERQGGAFLDYEAEDKEKSYIKFVSKATKKLKEDKKANKK